MEAEWVVYNGEKGSSVEHKVYCESWKDWLAYLKHNPERKGNNKLVARGLTQEQAEAMVQMTRED